MTAPLTILYTGGLRGNLNGLPRYAPLLRARRTHATGRVLLLDTGDACAPTSEPCAITNGRAAPIVLDAMGYHAANVTGYLDDKARTRLQHNYLNIALVSPGYPYIEQGIAYAAVPPEAIPHQLHIALDNVNGQATLSDKPTLNRIYTLWLASVQAWQAGEAVITWDGDIPTIARSIIHDIPRQTRPDATIAGTVDFVMDEVRYLKRIHRRE
jgi:hypothetical protein